MVCRFSRQRSYRPCAFNLSRQDRRITYCWIICLSNRRPASHLPAHHAFATVDYQQGARDVARCVGRQEEAWVGDFLDAAEALQCARARDHLLDLWIWPYARRCTFGVDRARCDAVNADACGAPFAGVRYRQVDYAGLRGAIRKHRGRAMHAGRRGDIDDRARAFLLDELARGRLRAEENAVEVDSDHRAPSVGREVERRRRDTGAVVVDQHVEAAEMFDRLRDHLVALLGVADVNLRHLAFTTGLANFVAHALEVLDLAARDQHRRAALGELFGDRLADPGTATGHNRNFAFDTKWILQNENFLRGGSFGFIAFLRSVG